MNDPAIKVGSIVRVKRAWWNEIGIVVKTNIWKPGGYLIRLPQYGMIERSLDLCHNATEAERKEYFKAVLKYG